MLLRTAALLLAALVLALAVGCEDTITAESYDQIEIGMDKTQVEDILGGSGELQAARGVGIGASGMTEMQGESGDTKSYLWGDENQGIVVKFRDGKVYHKQKMGL